MVLATLVLCVFTAAGVLATFWLASATREIARTAARQIESDIETRDYYWQQEVAKEERAAQRQQLQDAQSVIVEPTAQQVDLRFPASYQIKQVRGIILDSRSGGEFNSHEFGFRTEWIAPGYIVQRYGATGIPIGKSNRCAFEWADSRGTRWVNLDGKITRQALVGEPIEDAARRLDEELRRGAVE